MSNIIIELYVNWHIFSFSVARNFNNGDTMQPYLSSLIKDAFKMQFILTRTNITDYVNYCQLYYVYLDRNFNHCVYKHSHTSAISRLVAYMQGW